MSTIAAQIAQAEQELEKQSRHHAESVKAGYDSPGRLLRFQLTGSWVSDTSIATFYFSFASRDFVRFSNAAPPMICAYCWPPNPPLISASSSRNNHSRNNHSPPTRSPRRVSLVHQAHSPSPKQFCQSLSP